MEHTSPRRSLRQSQPIMYRNPCRRNGYSLRLDHKRLWHVVAGTDVHSDVECHDLLCGGQVEMYAKRIRACFAGKKGISVHNEVGKLLITPCEERRVFTYNKMSIRSLSANP